MNIESEAVGMIIARSYGSFIFLSNQLLPGKPGYVEFASPLRSGVFVVFLALVSGFSTFSSLSVLI